MSDALSGRSVIVTGAGRGIGAAMAKALAAAGGRLTIADIDANSQGNTSNMGRGADTWQALRHVPTTESPACYCAESRREPRDSVRGMLGFPP